MKLAIRLLLIFSLALTSLGWLPAQAAPSQATDFSCSDVIQIPQAECNALVALYNATGGPNWKAHTNWLESTSPCRDWYGITCSFFTNVTTLSLADNGLSGALPAEFGGLQLVEKLDLSHNQISGLPDSFGALLHAYDYNLSYNQIGSLPAGVGNMVSLRFLNLSHNQITSLPAEFGNLAGLEELDLEDNQLSSLPDSFANLSALNSLRIGNNLLADFPSVLSGMPNLRSLYLNGLGWTSVPSAMLGMTNLTALSLADNQLSSLPSELGNFSGLWLLDLSYNPLGAVPDWVPSLNSLAILKMNGAGLTSFPSGLPGLVQLGLAENQISGPLPIDQLLQRMPNLDVLNLSHNQFSGPIPAQLSDFTLLRSLNLSYNQLSGSIPPELINNKVGIFDLSHNQLSGPIPPELGGPEAANPVHDGRPPFPGDLPFLSGIDLSDNQLSGPIPAELGRRSTLAILDLSNNRLSGPIPAEIGNLIGLDTLDVHNNALSGAIPANLAGLTNLGTLETSVVDFGYNSLTVWDASLAAFLAQKDPDWGQTQTVTPGNVAAQLSLDTLNLTWTPILYPQDGGYYEVSYASNFDGPYTLYGVTADKSAASMLLTNLDPPGTVNYLRVRTYTPAHGEQQNDVWSDYSYPIAAGLLHLTPTTEQSLVFTNTQGARVNITIPAGAVSSNMELVFQPGQAPAGQPGFAGHSFSLGAYKKGVQQTGPIFEQPAQVTLRYKDNDIAEIDEMKLALLRWDGSQWVDAACGDYQRQPGENSLTAPVCQASSFGLFGPLLPDLYLPFMQR